MAQPCYKRRYADRIAAMAALARIDGRVRRSGQSGKAPVRVYRCARCHGWHLTSRPA